MKRIITQDRADQPYGYASLDANGNGMFGASVSSQWIFARENGDFVKYAGGRPVSIYSTLQSKAPLDTPLFTNKVSTDTDFVKRDPNGVLPDISIITSLANKADAATTNESLALKANSSDLATKADATATTNALATKADATATTNALALKAPLDSPTFTGTVTIPNTHATGWIHALAVIQSGIVKFRVVF